MTQKKRIPGWTKNLLKTGLVVGLFYYLYSKGAISFESTRRAFGRPELLIPAFGMLVLNMALGTLRWQLLLEAQGIRIPFRRVFNLNMIGNFFNIALPGAVSGDFVKAYYVGNEAPGQRSVGFGSILFDRVAGLSALVFLSAGVALFGHEHVPFRALQATRPFIITAALGVVVFYGYLFLVREHHDPVLRTLRKLETRVPRIGALTKTYLGLRAYHNHRGTVLKVIAVSLAVHLAVGWSLLQFAHALGDFQTHFIPLALVFPLGLLVTAVPVFPGGVGTGHLAFAFFFSLIGSPRGADVFTLWVLNSFAIGALGGIVYLRHKVQLPEAPQAAQAFQEKEA